MTSVNSFDLLGNDDSDDPLMLFEKQKQIEEAKNVLATAAVVSSQSPSFQANLQSKPIFQVKLVRNLRSNPASRGGDKYAHGWKVRGGGFVQNRNPGQENGSSVAGDSFDKERGTFTWPRPNFNYNGLQRRWYPTNDNGHSKEVSDRLPMRNFNKINRTRHGNGPVEEIWNQLDDVVVTKVFAEEQPLKNEDESVGSEKKQNQNHTASNNTRPTVQAILREDKMSEDKEMTLEQYQKVKEDKRKRLLAMKTEERKVELDKELKCMHQLSNNRKCHDIFIKLGTADKDSRKTKNNAGREERSKKLISINEFLKPAEEQRYNAPGGRGSSRGMSRGGRAALRNGGDAGADKSFGLKNIVLDEVQFPVLG